MMWRIAYRMYTVVGRMLDLIDDLTNWYIRFNRRRLKGDSGVEDAVLALQTLFETLLTLARTLVSSKMHAFFSLSLTHSIISSSPLSFLSLPRIFIKDSELSSPKMSPRSTWATIFDPSISYPSQLFD